MMKSIPLRSAMVAFAAAAAFAAGCGGGGGGNALAPHAASTSGGAATAVLRIVIPQKSSTSARRRITYVSPSTTQLVYTIDGGATNSVALTPSNPQCTGSPLTCNVLFQSPPGAHVFSFITEDANGSPLSGVTNLSATLVAGQANTLNVTLGGIATQVVVQPTASANRVTGSSGGGFQIYGNTAVQLMVVLEDADGNAIVGPGAPQPSIAPSPGAPYTIATPSANSNVWTLTSSYQPTDPTVPSSTSITIVATPVPSSGPAYTVTQPISLALFQPWVYVLNSGSGTVTAYDELGNAKAVAGFAGLSGPRGLAFNNGAPTGASPTPDPYFKTVYVTNANANSLSLFVPTGSATSAPGSFSGLASPAPVTFDSNNKQLYIANLSGSPNLVSYGESGSAATLSSITVANPKALAFDSFDNYILLATSSAVTAYNESGTQIATWTTGLNSPAGITFDSDNGFVYVSNGGNSTVTVYTPTGAQRSTTFSVLSTPGPIAFDVHNNLLYVANASSLQAYSEAGVSQGLAVAGLNAPTAVVVIP